VRASALAGLDPCVHCGFCLQSCPTYLVTDDEADSPRGRIVLMRAMAARRFVPGDSVVAHHLDRCLGCRACEPVCPSGVEYGPAIEDARRVLHDARPLHPIVRITHAIMAEPLFRRPFLTAARLVRPLAASLAGRSRPGFALGMLAATRPLRTHTARRGISTDGAGTPVALFRGCIMDDLFSHVHDATERVLTANGYAVHGAAGQGCCGALHVHAGQHEAGRELARRNVEAFSSRPDGALIAVNAAGCGAILKEYGRLLEGDPLQTQGEMLAASVRDVSEFLSARGPAPGARLDLRVAYDPPCHLAHAQRITTEPETLIDAIDGLERVRHHEADLCCGSAGSYSLAQPAISLAVLDRKVAAIRDAGPDVVASGNPGCIMQIGAGLLAAGLTIPVVHPVELLDWSYERAGRYAP
jgi:glycolate oxidase iron-sulfur subunit